jgi:hypothetical protein
MKLFFAVVVDLFEFVSSAFTFSKNKNADKPASGSILLLTKEVPSVVRPELQQFVQKPVVAVGVLESTEMAYVAVSAAKVMEQPRWLFDTVVMHSEYGDAVKILSYEGRFVQIQYKNQYGWILKDEITFNQNDVLPNLQEGKVYLATDAETKKLRQIIKDEYFAADLYLPLQSVEFVTYILERQGIKIAWPIICPRVAGRWQVILKGARGVFMTIAPKTGSVMEYYTQSGLGQVLYVKSVLPDETIILCGVGMTAEGVYSETKLSKANWQELGAVFIQFT